MKNFQTVTLLAFVCCIHVISSRESFETENPEFKPRQRFGRIVGGYRPNKHEVAKHLVSLRYGKDDGIFGANHICAGSIITPNLILTAAHCVTQLPSDKLRHKSQMKVIVGNIDRLEHTSWEQIFDVNEIVRHAEFDQETAYADLALLQLDKTIVEDGEHIQRIEIVNEMPRIGENCYTVGWGQIIVNGPLTDELVYANVTLFSPMHCALSMRVAQGIICGGDVHGYQKIAGKGDSGGPLICNGKLAGINSFVTTLQTYYTAVYFFRDWILKGQTNSFEPNYILVKLFTVRLLSHIFY